MSTRPEQQGVEMDIDADMEEIMETGDRLPEEMWEPGMSSVMLRNPVFNGEQVVEGTEG